MRSDYGFEQPDTTAGRRYQRLPQWRQVDVRNQQGIRCTVCHSERVVLAQALANAAITAADVPAFDSSQPFAVTAAAAARSALCPRIEYVGVRKVFGRPLAEFENTWFRLAELSATMATNAASGAFADARFLRLAAQRFSDPRTALAGRIGL